MDRQVLVQRVLVSVVIPSETINKKKKTERGRQRSVRQPRVTEPNRIRYDQTLRRARGRGNINFPCSPDHEQDWQPYPVDPYSAICDDHTYIHTAVREGMRTPKKEGKEYMHACTVHIAVV